MSSNSRFSFRFVGPRGTPSRWGLLLLGAAVVAWAGCNGEGEEEQAGHSGLCVSSSDCEPGYACEAGVCVSGQSGTCIRDSDCGSGYVCEQGLCVRETSDGPGDEVAGECETDDDCGENARCKSTEDGTVCACDENYRLEDDVCVPRTRLVDCTNEKPEDSSWKPEYEGGVLVQTWDGEEFVPPADSCEWECDDGYLEHAVDGAQECVQCVDHAHCDSPTPYCLGDTFTCVECKEHEHCSSGRVCYANTCEDTPRIFVCDPKPEGETEWNSVSEYEQEWNPETQSWEPESSETHFNEEADEESCRYTCSPGYRFNGLLCEERPVCSTGNQLGGSTAKDLFAAMDLCEVYGVDGAAWGIVPGSAVIGRANWPDASGTVSDRQFGVKTRFGTDDSNLPRFGDNLAILSTGRAGDANDGSMRGTHDDSYTYTLFPASPPQDFVAPHGGSLPVTREGCSAGFGVFDSVNLRAEIKVPDFAHGFSFDFRFFSQEYMNFTCTDFNDFFIVMLDTTWAPEDDQEPIPADKNISFDSFGNYISVNSDQFFTVCQPKTCSSSGAEYECPDGTDALADTGYPPSRAGATTWLTTTAPVVPGETITLRFIIWDTSDALLDSLVLLDNFRWHAQPTDGPETQPGWQF